MSKQEGTMSYGKIAFYGTLVGKVYKYLKKYDSCNTEQIIMYLMGKKFTKGNGKKFSFSNFGECRQALLGTQSTGIFTVAENNWTLNAVKGKDYKKGKITKYNKQTGRKKYSLPLYTKSQKLFRKIKFLEKTASQMRASKETGHYFTEAFKHLDGDENIKEASEKIGHSRLLGMLEGFAITSKYFNKAVSQNYKTSTSSIQDRLLTIQEKLSKFDDLAMSKK